MTKSDHQPRAGITRRGFGAAAAAGAASLAFPWAPAIAQGSNKLKIGLILPFSGPQAQIGQDEKRGAIAAQKLLPTVGYADFDIVYGDTETKPEIARAVAAKLANDGCNVLMGCFDSGQTIAAVQVAEQQGVPFVVNVGAAPQITESGYKWVVRDFPSVPMILNDAFTNQKALFDYTKKAPKTVVILHTNDTYGTIVANNAPKLAASNQMPYKILNSIAYDPAAKDLSLEVAKAKGSGADALIVVSRLNDAILITKELVRQRWTPMGIMSIGPGWYEPSYLKTLGKLSDDVISFVPWYDPNKPMTKKLEAEMKKLYPTIVLNPNHTCTFEAVLVACDAFKRAGTTDPKTLMKALKDTRLTNGVSIGPAVTFDAKGQNAHYKCAAVQNEGGKLKVVIPRSAAEAEPVWPIRPWNKRA
jgi:branched-chain amino acid transport system substrate-binding protein